MKKNTQWTAGDILAEAKVCEEHLACLYNAAALAARSEKIRRDMLDILKDVHQLHHDIDMVMQRRGLYTFQAADPTEIARIRQQLG
ncbi:MAG: spore coat protein [Firmicutes bacterium]|nr:spore coat protein [Bacillota bacterium]HOB35536.1 spore coat protein [Bacillota bacterium]HPZ90533.1 spore coat protein [Bacillota bacterium]HQE02633.1 spore coat protein [Bacillota bacterium]